MLSFIARFGSSKGMVAVPNLSGLSRSQAQTAISNAGLVFGGESSTSTTNSSLDGKVASQSPSAGSLVDYATSVSYQYYIYVAPAAPTITSISYGSCYNVGTPTSSYTCSDPYTKTPTTTQERQRDVTYYYSDGSVTYGTEACTSTTTSGTAIQNSADCGYVAPVKTCTASCGTYSAWGSCQNVYAGGGVQYRTRTCTRTDCSTYTQTDSRSCCAATCGSWSAYGSCVNGVKKRTRTCTKTDCSTYTETQSISCTGGAI